MTCELRKEDSNKARPKKVEKRKDFIKAGLFGSGALFVRFASAVARKVGSYIYICM